MLQNTICPAVWLNVPSLGRNNCGVLQIPSQITERLGFNLMRMINKSECLADREPLHAEKEGSSFNPSTAFFSFHIIFTDVA